MGLRLLVDLSHALGVKVDTGRPTRLVEADLPTIIQTFEGSELKLRLTPAASLAPGAASLNGMMSIYRLSRTGL